MWAFTGEERELQRNKRMFLRPHSRYRDTEADLREPTVSGSESQRKRTNPRASPPRRLPHLPHRPGPEVPSSERNTHRTDGSRTCGLGERDRDFQMPARYQREMADIAQVLYQTAHLSTVGTALTGMTVTANGLIKYGMPHWRGANTCNWLNVRVNSLQFGHCYST